MCSCSCSCLSIYLSTYLPIYLSVCLSISNLQAWKRSNSARLPQLLNLVRSKRKQFCETSSFFSVGNIKNDAILRDFVNIWSWQHQKRSNSARLSSIMEGWMQSWRPSTNAFCDFSSPCLWSIARARKKWCQAIQSAACTFHKKSSSQNWRSDAPKCSPSQEISALTS